MSWKMKLMIFFTIHLFLQVVLFLSSADDRCVPSHPAYTPAIEKKVIVSEVGVAVIGFPFVTLMWELALLSSEDLFANELGDLSSLFIDNWLFWLFLNSLIWTVGVYWFIWRSPKKTEDKNQN